MIISTTAPDSAGLNTSAAAVPSTGSKLPSLIAVSNGPNTLTAAARNTKSTAPTNISATTWLCTISSIFPLTIVKVSSMNSNTNINTPTHGIVAKVNFVAGGFSKNITAIRKLTIVFVNSLSPKIFVFENIA